MGCGSSVSKIGDIIEPQSGSRDVAAAPAGDGMGAYPPDFAAELMSLAREAGLLAAGDEDQKAEIDESVQQLKGMGALDEAVCVRLKDMGLSAGDAAAAELLKGGEGLEDAQQRWAGACDPRPPAVGEGLWTRTKEMFVSGGRWACAEKAGDEATAAKEQKAFMRHSRAIKGFGPGKGPKDAAAFQDRASEVMPANVIMFSGCQDQQTSADVQNTASFGLPEDAGPGGAGGACTNAMIKSLSEKGDPTWVELLRSMRTILHGKYTQIPQMSSSKSVDLNTPFSVVHGEPSGRFRALLVGINYVGTKAELRGCHNDVETMRRYLEEHSYSGDNIKLLLDDGEHDDPNKQNIEDGFAWLIEGAEVGDSLFFHYSGHGASVRDDNNEEPDGKDEALCPSDYSSAGLIRDDQVFKCLVAPLKEGVKLTCVLDCCHSGTILDLPFMFKADDSSLQAVESGGSATMLPNPGFDFGKVLQVLKDNPLLVAGAVGVVAVGGIALMSMGKENRSRALGAVGGQDQLLNTAMQQLGGNAQLMGFAKSFLG